VSILAPFLNSSLFALIVKETGEPGLVITSVDPSNISDGLVLSHAAYSSSVRLGGGRAVVSLGRSAGYTDWLRLIHSLFCTDCVPVTWAIVSSHEAKTQKTNNNAILQIANRAALLARTRWFLTHVWRSAL
jgi:hypothetical protein